MWRLFVEKKSNFRSEAESLLGDLREQLRLTTLTDLRILQRYDIEGVSEDALMAAISTVFAEPPVDDVYRETFPITPEERAFASSFSLVNLINVQTLLHNVCKSSGEGSVPQSPLRVRM